MRHLRVIAMLVLVLSLAALAGACKRPPETVPTPAPAPETVPAEKAPPPPKKEVTETFRPPPVEKEPLAESSIDELNRQGILRTVYFAFDKYDLDETARITLQANAKWLTDHPEYRIVIEGHCDERGTIEYNLALGERRANAAREYVVGLGVPASRMRIITYGEERPVDPGHNESAWSRNRRGEFKVESRIGS